MGNFEIGVVGQYFLYPLTNLKEDYCGRSGGRLDLSQSLPIDRGRSVCNNGTIIKYNG